MRKIKQFRLCLLLLSLISIAHAPLLFNTGIYFDGWMLFDWVRTGNWKECLDFFRRLGMPMMAFWYWPSAHWLPYPLGFKVLSYVWIVAGAGVTFAIWKQEKASSDELRFWVLLLASLTPTLVTVIEPTHFCYHSFYFVFQCAVWAFLRNEKRNSQKRRWAAPFWRIFSLGLFFLSFNFNALLTYYYSAWALWNFFRGREFKQNITTHMRYVFWQRLDFTLLPLVFWGWKQIFTPTFGDQVDYNRIGFGVAMLGPLLRLPYVIATQFWEVLSFLNYPIVAIGALALALIIWIFGSRKQERSERQQAFVLLGAGLCLFIGATFPYIAAARGFSLGLNGDRMNFLYSFPVALLVVGITRAFSTKVWVWRLARGGLGILAGLFFIQTVVRYTNWQMRAITDESILLQIDELEILRKATIFKIEDRIQLPDRWDDRYWYIDHKWTFLMAGLGGGMKWLGIPVRRPDLSPKFRFNRTSLEAFLVRFKLTYYAQGIDLDGKQATLIIDPGPLFRDNWNTVLEYYLCKYLYPNELGAFLKGLVHLQLLAEGVG